MTNSDKFKMGGDFNYTGIVDDMIRLVESEQLKDKELWRMVVEQFKSDVDDEDNGWRGEYWGKLMRGACAVYSYTYDNDLYSAMRTSVRAIISSADQYGRISTYSTENEFCGWDMWSRKYVLLGLIYFYGICPDKKLRNSVIDAAKGQLDYIIENIGSADGQTQITDTSAFWGGINSSSILEPTVLLYNITNENKYLDFAHYIVENGGAKGFDIFEAAYEDKLAPYEYPVDKAYELMSCFDGLIEYYKVTNCEKWKTAAENFANKIIDTEITIIGSAGCKHELFNHSSLMQTYTGYSGLMQETCVTVTWIRLCLKLLLLTGNRKYADEIEKSVYNALYGAVNTERCLCGDETTFDLDWYRGVYDKYHKKYPKGQVFDSYSPLRSDIRGRAVGGFKAMRNKTAYCGCCIAIGAVGVGLVPHMSVLKGANEFAFMMYIPGKVHMTTKQGTDVEFDIKTQYPSNGKVSICVNPGHEEIFAVSLRIPSFARNTVICVNGEQIESVTAGSMLTLKRNWSPCDKIEIDFDMALRTIHGMVNENDENSENHIAVLYGPVALARDARIGKVGDTLTIDGGNLSMSKSDDSLGVICNCNIQLDDNTLHMIDYASAGKSWRRDSEMEVWINTRHI